MGYFQKHPNIPALHLLKCQNRMLILRYFITLKEIHYAF